MSNCTHGVLRDHTEGKEKGSNIWVCTNCNSKGTWTHNHSSYGSMECFDCSMPTFDWVACSDGCAEELAKRYDSDLSSQIN